MWLIICWLVGLKKVLCHFLLSLCILILYLSHKIRASAENPRAVVQQQYDQCRKYTSSQNKLIRDKVKMVLMEGSRVLREQQLFGGHRQQQQQQQQQQQNNRKDVNQFYVASMAVLIALVCANQWPVGVHGLEQDAQILQPVANIAKAVTKTITLGEPLDISFDPTGMVKNFAYFTWRTRFPVSMPSGFVQKAQDFYNRVKLRVDLADVSNYERKSLANLKLDLDDIVDSIVEEVRQSPDGLYTDYLNTRVNGTLLEDACTQVGMQLKAYKMDLTNYRNIAGAVLGVPLMPTVASTVVNVASMAQMDRVQNLTSSLSHLPGSAIGGMTSVSGQALNTLGGALGGPMQNLAQVSPLSLFARQPQAVQA